MPDVIPNVTENLAWANDNRTLFYGKQDETTLRQHQIWRHMVGTDPAKDQLVYQEDDETFGAYIFKTKSKKFLMIVSSQTVSQEYRYLDAGDPTANSKCFCRGARARVSLDHFEERFIIRTNDQAKNFRLMSAPVAKNREGSIGGKSCRTAMMSTWATSMCSKTIWCWRSVARPDPDPYHALVGRRRSLSCNLTSRRTALISEPILNSTPRLCASNTLR